VSADTKKRFVTHPTSPSPTDSETIGFQISGIIFGKPSSKGRRSCRPSFIHKKHEKEIQMPGDQEKPENNITLAMAAVGVALTQTLVELDGRVLKIIQEKAKDLRAHMTTIRAQEADLVLATFVRALHDKRFFPQQPE
jgi:hypothetical protein